MLWSYFCWSGIISRNIVSPSNRGEGACADMNPDASVSEHFYQLHLVPHQRVATPRLTALEGRRRIRLSSRQRWGLLVFLVGLPYLRIKAQQYFESLRGTDGDTQDLTRVSDLLSDL
jgi:hypothetical protein